ncbi:MAG TPA: PqqD family protein [Methylomirabilota bacterium]
MSTTGPPGGARPSACPRRRSDVRARAVEGEMVVLDRQRQLVHQLNQTASYVWERCDGEHTVPTIARDLAGVFEVDLQSAETDVANAVRQLEAAGLVEMASARVPAPGEMQRRIS